MKVSFGIPRRMLEVEKLNYRRQCCSFISILISASIFILITLSQCGLLSWMGKNKNNFWLTIDFISVMAATLSLVCGLVLIFLVEREKEKIRKKVKYESKALGFKSRIEEEKEKKNLLGKCSDILEALALKMDMLGTSCNFSIQLASLSFLLVNGIAIGEVYKFGASNMPVSHIVDLVSNSAYFLAALFLAISHVIITRKSDNSSQNAREMNKMMALMLLGSSLVFGGKIVCSLNAVGKLPQVVLENGMLLPIGWFTRTVGIVMLAVSFWMVMQKTSQKCDNLAKIVEEGTGDKKVMTTVSTQDVRSCLGYMEYGTR